MTLFLLTVYSDAMGLFHHNSHVKSAILGLILVSNIHGTWGRNVPLAPHTTPDGGSRLCNVITCNEGSEAVVCEAGRPDTTQCVPCPDGLYMDRSTLSTQNKKCKIKRVCSWNDGKTLLKENDGTRNRQCQCMKQYNYYPKNSDGKDPNYSAAECYHCPGQHDYVHSTIGCTLCQGDIAFDEYGNKLCNHSLPSSTPNSGVTNNLYLDRQTTTAQPEGQAEHQNRTDEIKFTTTQQSEGSQSQQTEGFVTEYVKTSSSSRPWVIAVILPAVICIILGLGIGLWRWKKPAHDTAQAEKESVGLLNPQGLSLSGVSERASFEREGLQNSAEEGVSTPAGLDPRTRGGVPIAAGPDLRANGDVSIAEEDVSTTTDLNLHADESLRRMAATSYPPSGPAQNPRQRETVDDAPVHEEDAQNVWTNKHISTTVDTRAPTVQVTVTVNNHMSSPLNPSTCRQGVPRMDSTAHGQHGEEYVVCERSVDNYPVQVEETIQPQAEEDICSSTDH